MEFVKGLVCGICLGVAGFNVFESYRTWRKAKRMLQRFETLIQTLDSQLGRPP